MKPKIERRGGDHKSEEFKENQKGQNVLIDNGSVKSPKLLVFWKSDQNAQNERIDFREILTSSKSMIDRSNGLLDATTAPY